MPALISDVIRAFKSFGATEKFFVVALSVTAGLYVAGSIANLFPKHTIEASPSLRRAWGTGRRKKRRRIAEGHFGPLTFTPNLLRLPGCR